MFTKEDDKVNLTALFDFEGNRENVRKRVGYECERNNIEGLCNNYITGSAESCYASSPVPSPVPSPELFSEQSPELSFVTSPVIYPITSPVTPHTTSPYVPPVTVDVTNLLERVAKLEKLKDEVACMKQEIDINKKHIGIVEHKVDKVSLCTMHIYK